MIVKSFNMAIPTTKTKSMITAKESVGSEMVVGDNSIKQVKSLGYLRHFTSRKLMGKVAYWCPT